MPTRTVYAVGALISVSLVVVSLLLVGVLGTSAGISASFARGASPPSWRVVAHGAAVPPLTAVAAFSSMDVWAVGGSEDVSKPVIVHWDGKTLRTTSFPWKDAEFSGVAGASPRDVWAVGSINEESALVVHWDGRRWQRAQLPSTGKGAWLADVTAISQDDVWVVGGVGGRDLRPLVLHWNGRRWRVVDMRDAAPRGSDLRAIDSASGADVWAAGEQNVDAPSTMGFSALVLHWDGNRWRQVPSAQVPVDLAVGPGSGCVSDDVAWAIDIAPSGEVWTADMDYGGEGPCFVRLSGPTRGAAHFYGQSIDGDPFPSGIAAVSRTSVWVVGDRETVGPGELGSVSLYPVVSHWNGISWRVQDTPFDGLKNATLDDLTALSPTDIWAAGNHLLVHYSR